MNEDIGTALNFLEGENKLGYDQPSQLTVVPVDGIVAAVLLTEKLLNSPPVIHLADTTLKQSTQHTIASFGDADDIIPDMDDAIS